MIASVAFRNFKALRNAQLELAPFNLVIGPNGSGKTSLIEALMRLRSLSKLPLREPVPESDREIVDGPEVVFRFLPPHDSSEAVISCVSDTQCDLLQVDPLGADWPALRARLQGMRSYVFDHHAIAARSPARDGAELLTTGANLAAVLATLRKNHPADFAALQAELIRILPEYAELDCVVEKDGLAGLVLVLREGGERIPADNVSQGTLYLLTMLALAFDPAPPSVVCIEEIDRGFHPRLLRDVRDVLYRLSHPDGFGLKRVPVQVIATTHSPYLLDLFRDHPEEIVISEKQGASATFSRLADRGDLKELLEEGTLGDMWFTGILGGVPEEKND
ncbi:MAG: AAA family ATPase [Nibricoccus sp.]